MWQSKTSCPISSPAKQIDNFVGISSQIQIEFSGGGAMSSPCGWVLCKETRSRTCGVKLDGFFCVDLFFPVKHTCFYRSDDFFYLEVPPMCFCFSGGCSCGALPNAPPNSDLTKSASGRTPRLGFAAFFLPPAQQPMWPFWRQKNWVLQPENRPGRKRGPGETRSSRTGLQKNRGPGEQGNPKKTAKQPAGT
jgi:hypothetical protein